MFSIEELFTFVCSGDIEKLKEYYENGGETNRRYYAFCNYHSLLMGAFRNEQFEVIDYLIEKGEKMTEEEYQEVVKEMNRIYAIKKLISIM